MFNSLDPCASTTQTPWNPGPGQGHVLSWEKASPGAIDKNNKMTWPDHWAPSIDGLPDDEDKDCRAMKESPQTICVVAADDGAPTRCGKQSVRFELHVNWKRVELAGHYGPQGDCFEPPRAHRWYAFSTYLHSWDTHPKGEIVTQWHQHWDLPVSGRYSPPLAIMTCDDHWAISVPSKWDGTVNDTDEYCVDKYVRGTWSDWVVHVQWADTSNPGDGLVEIWKDRKLVYYVTGQNTYNVPPNWSYGNYMKFGIYKWDWAYQDAQRIMYYDALQICDGDYGGDYYRSMGPPCEDKVELPRSSEIVQGLRCC